MLMRCACAHNCVSNMYLLRRTRGVGWNGELTSWLYGEHLPTTLWPKQGATTPPARCVGWRSAGFWLDMARLMLNAVQGWMFSMWRMGASVHQTQKGFVPHRSGDGTGQIDSWRLAAPLPPDKTPCGMFGPLATWMFDYAWRCAFGRYNLIWSHAHERSLPANLQAHGSEATPVPCRSGASSNRHQEKCWLATLLLGMATHCHCWPRSSCACESKFIHH